MSLLSSSSTIKSSPSLMMYDIWTTIFLFAFVYCDLASNSIVPAAVASYVDAGSSSVFSKNFTQVHRHTPLTPSSNPSREARSLENGSYHTGGRSSSPSLNYNCTSGRPDIFEKFCSCNGTRVNCDFSVNRQLTTITDDNFRVPQFTNSLHVILGPSTNFILKSGIFVSAKINDLVIVGHLRGEQVEITSNVFQDHGPYPSVNITDCGSVIIRTNAFLSESKLHIQRSKDVIISEHAFYNTNLRATLKDIQDLRIEEQSFDRVSLKVISSKLNNLYRFKGRLRDISFSNCTIGIVNSDTFDVHMIDSLSFDECVIQTIKSRVFTEKLISQSIQINRSKIDTIESDAFAGSGITNLLLTENRISTIEANAIRVIAANVRIDKNDIVNTYNNWFDASECSNIKIVNNAFGSLAAFNIANSSSAQPGACKFEGNSIQKPLPKSLNLQTPFCQIRKISVDYICTCNTSWLEQLSDRDLRSESYCKIDRSLQSCFNTTLMNLLKYFNKTCHDSDTIHCERKNDDLLRVNGHFITREELERATAKDNKLIIIIIIIILLCAVILCIAGYACWRWLRSKRENPGKSLHSVRGVPPTDPIYAEPTAPLESSYDRTEHIYAEPGGTQKPLLGSEYSSPSDRQEDQGGLYSEPIYNGVTSLQPSFVTTNLIQLPAPKVQQPSTSHNLPDVIDQSSRDTHKKPMTNVKIMAQNLENNPQFSGRPPINAPLYSEADTSRKGFRKPFTGIVEKPTTERRRHTGNVPSSDGESDHSGGSDVTIKIDDIEYADA